MAPPFAAPSLHPLAISQVQRWLNFTDRSYLKYLEDRSLRYMAFSFLGRSEAVEALSKRIHYGKFVAEVKFQQSPAVYKAAIQAKDRAQLMHLLTYEAVEAAVKKRVEMKAKIYGQEVNLNGSAVDSSGQEVDEDNLSIQPKKHESSYKIQPSLVADLYSDWIMPLTKFVQVEYLLRRLD
ncbi:Chorismate mutase 3 [Nymphaea thermarum]|nr:Chorismate mutase 3 [Nymphaea thermarum]